MPHKDRRDVEDLRKEMATEDARKCWIETRFDANP